MTYDQFKTSPPEPPPKPCECEWSQGETCDVCGTYDDDERGEDDYTQDFEEVRNTTRKEES